MKTTIFLSMFLFFSAFIYAQCNTQFAYNCAVKTADNIYLRDFNASFGNKKSEKFKVYLNIGYSYKLHLCNPSEINNMKNSGISGAMLTLYDAGNNVIAQTNGKGEFAFTCNKSGVFYVQIERLNELTTCAVGILSYNPSK